jgi:hypothetical protein
VHRHVEDHLDGAPAVDERHHETRATVEWEREDVVVGGDEPRNRVEWNGSGDVAAAALNSRSVARTKSLRSSGIVMRSLAARPPCAA